MNASENDQDPGIASAVSCPRCGAPMRRAARRVGTGWADYHTCTDCREAVGPLPRPKPPQAEDLQPLLPAGEVSARSGSIDDRSREASAHLDAIAQMADDASRRVLEHGTRAVRPLPGATLHAIHGITLEVRNRMGDLVTILTARAAQEEPAVAWAFTGWHRAGRREKWKPICCGATESEIWDLLIISVHGGDKVVAEDGIDPNERRRPR
jgi:hypothetical protein